MSVSSAERQAATVPLTEEGGQVWTVNISACLGDSGGILQAIARPLRIDIPMWAVCHMARW